MSTLIKDQITKFTQEVIIIKAIKFGSDEHLDFINIRRKPIVFLTLLLSTLNKNLNGFYNSETTISSDDLNLLNKVNSVNSQFYSSRKRSKYYSYFKEALAEFNEQRQVTKEIVNDFKEFRTNSEDYRKLQKSLKSI